MDVRTEPGTLERSGSASGVSEKSVGFVFAEDAVGGEGAQHAIERGGVRAGDGGELLGSLGLVGEVVCEAQLGGCAEQKWDGIAQRHSHELCLG